MNFRLEQQMRRVVFDAAVSQHRKKVFTLAYYMLGNREEAEDLSQEVLIRLWRRGHEVDPDRLGSWLLRVTRNACIDVLRQRSTSAEIIQFNSPGSGVQEPAEASPDPETLAQASETGSEIFQALAVLAEPFQSVVILREVQGLSYQEISDALEMPLNSVRVYLHRGRRRLREVLMEVRHDVAAC